MKPTKAFTFIDAMTALLILLGSGTVLASLAGHCLKSKTLQQEQAIAYQLLNQVRTIDEAHLPLFNNRTYDALGRPGTDAAHFNLSVVKSLGHADIEWWEATLTYINGYGRPQSLTFRRRAT